MDVRVEPGYYENSSFGVRIENVELIKEIETKYGVSLTMEPLTLVSDFTLLSMVFPFGFTAGSYSTENGRSFSSKQERG